MYALVWHWRRSRAEAIFAAGLLGFSWEFAYHARWIAPDALLLQFAALTLFALFRAVHAADGRNWLYVASVAAGLACGTKYPGGLLMAPVGVATLMVVWRLGPSGRERRLVQTSVVAVVLFVGWFLVTTPGAVLEPEMFRANVDYEVKHYHEYGHIAHTVDAGLPHAALMIEYLAGHFLSPLGWIAWSGAALALVGLYALARERPALAAMVVLFPLLHVLYMQAMIVFIVRNLLVDAPFLVILTARGAAFVYSRLPFRIARMGFASIGLGALLINAAFLGQAAERTRNRSFDRSLQEVAVHVRSRPDATFSLSPRVRTGLDRLGVLEGLENVVDSHWGLTHALRDRRVGVEPPHRPVAAAVHGRSLVRPSGDQRRLLPDGLESRRAHPRHPLLRCRSEDARGRFACEVKVRGGFGRKTSNVVIPASRDSCRERDIRRHGSGD